MSLNCATHAYAVIDRDGGTVAASGTLTAVSWSRLLNDVSTASVSVAVAGSNCCEELGRIRSWRHRLDIYRVTGGGSSPTSSSLVWSGPIINIDWHFDEVSINAVDVLGWLDRRVPHQDFTFVGTDVTEIARQLVEDGYAPDDPGHTTTVIAASGVTGGRAYEQNVGQTADHLRDLAKTGIDFTAVGNNIVILPDGFCEVVGRLSDTDMPEGLSVSEDGASLVTRAIVAGPDDGDPVGTAGGTNSYYGLLEKYAEQRYITDQAAADVAAQAALDASLAVPVFIDTQNVTISPLADVTVDQLVPGWCLDITSQSTCRTITQRLKITGLQVSEDGGSIESPGSEKVQVQVAATGGELTVT